MNNPLGPFQKLCVRLWLVFFFHYMENAVRALRNGQRQKMWAEFGARKNGHHSSPSRCNHEINNLIVLIRFFCSRWRNILSFFFFFSLTQCVHFRGHFFRRHQISHTFQFCIYTRSHTIFNIWANISMECAYDAFMPYGYIPSYTYIIYIRTFCPV